MDGKHMRQNICGFVERPTGQWIIGSPVGRYGVWIKAKLQWDDEASFELLRLDVGLLVEPPNVEGRGEREPAIESYHRQRVSFAPFGSSKRRSAFANTREVFFDEDCVEPLNYVAAFQGDDLVGFGRMRPRYGGPDARFGYIFGVGELIISFE